MATPTLDEIEAGLDVVEPYLTHDYQRSLLALVAHVRALENVTRMTDDRAFERITALETTVGDLTGFAVKDVERIAALEEKVAKEARSAWKPAADEMDRLRAENAELRAANGKLREENGSLHTAKIDWEEENAELRKRIAELEEWWRCNLCFGSGFYVANSGAGKVECPYCGPSVSREKPTAAKPWPAPAWPAPQPIETAPLGTVLFAWNAQACSWQEHYTRSTPPAVSDRSAFPWWIPKPPPPGGAK